jgi:DNA-binding transcriptional ArsR family regulator
MPDPAEAPPRPLADDHVALAVETLRMVADHTRIRILWALTSREMSVNEIAALVDKAPATVSQHLAKLRMSRMVHTRREGTTIHYSLENDHVRRLVIDTIHNAEHAGPGTPAHHQGDATPISNPSTATG